MNDLMKQAARMQRQIQTLQEAMKAKEFTASALSDKIKATVTGAKKVVRVDVDEEFWKSEDRDMVLDGIAAAINLAADAADTAIAEEMAKITGGVKIPGLTI